MSRSSHGPYGCDLAIAQYEKKNPDFAYINTNTQWVPVVLKDLVQARFEDHLCGQ
jgi:hypothetical protein